MGRWRHVLQAGLASAVLVGCAGANHRSQEVVASSPTASTQTSALRSAAAMAGLGNRTVAARELPGFAPTRPIVVTAVRTWLNIANFDPVQRRAALSRLNRLGFLAGAKVDLVPVGGGRARAISVVEEFGTSASARAELTARLPSLGRSSQAFVPGIPDARSLRVIGMRASRYNVVFTSGPYFYLVSVSWPNDYRPQPLRDMLATAARQLYSRVNES